MMEVLELINDIDDHPLIMMSPSVNTITFYEGIPPVDYLRSKVAAILLKNPWLTGRMHSRSKRLPGVKGTDILYSKSSDLTVNTVDGYFQVRNDVNMHTNVEYVQLARSLLPLQIKKGSDCLDQATEPLFRVLLIVSDPTHFGVMFSFSHVLGDGFTHYELYGMLSRDTQVDSLEASRHPGVPALIEDMIGGPKNSMGAFLSSPGVIVNVLTTMLFGSKVTTRMNMVNQNWVEQQKDTYQAAVSAAPSVNAVGVGAGVGVAEKGRVTSGNAITTGVSDIHSAMNSTSERPSFLSSNDILTSYWFNFMRADFGIMAMNLRKRIPALTYSMAGNYEHLAGYQKRDFEVPESIRLSLPHAKGYYSPSLPGFWDIFSARISILSSWVTFYRDVELEGCSQILHLPCADDQNIAVCNLAVLFRPRKGELAMMSFTRGFTDSEFLQSDVMGEILMRGPTTTTTSESSTTNSADVVSTNDIVHVGKYQQNKQGGSGLTTMVAVLVGMSAAAAAAAVFMYTGGGSNGIISLPSIWRRG